MKNREITRIMTMLQNSYNGASWHGASIMDHRRREHCETERDVRIPELALEELPIDRPGNLVLKLSDLTAHPLTGASPSHPAMWREIPDSGDFALQTDLRLERRTLGPLPLRTHPGPGHLPDLLPPGR